MKKRLPTQPDLKKWLKVHSVALGVTATLIVVLGGVLGLYFIDDRFSPSDIRTGTDGATLRLAVSDHDQTPNPVLLPNSLTDGTAPEYTNTHFMSLAKDTNGNLPSLFRIQGTLSYNSPNNTDKATVVVNLPPRLLLTPDKLAFGQSTYTFTYQPNGMPNAPSKAGTGTESVTIERVADSVNDPRSEAYKVTISNIDKKRFALSPLEHARELYAQLNPLLEKAQAYSPPPAGNILIFKRPYNFRMTFRDLAPPINNGIFVPAANIDTLVSYLSERTDQDNLFLANSSCGGNESERGFLCAKTTTQAFSPTTTLMTLPLHQKIELEGVYLAGNIAALVEIQNIKLFPNSIAVGGELRSVTGTTLSRYLQSHPSSILRWDNGVDDQITVLFNRGAQGTTAEALNGTLWQLNSPSTDPDDPGPATTFSSPPEGKLWRTVGGLTLPDNVDFRGSGTIVVNGNLTFNGAVRCSGAKRLAFIVRGNITFGGQPEVQCGAYVALGNAGGSLPGHLKFIGEPPSGGATAKGIFIARKDIQIPDAATSPQMIDYDAEFAANPTVLFREFLNVVLSASS